MSNREGSVVWLTEERCFGVIVGSLNAHYTTICYTKGGIEYEEFVENNEFEILEDLNEYDSDE